MKPNLPSFRSVLPLLAAGLLTACASAPTVHYYTLLRPPADSAPPIAATTIELLSVKVPAGADYPQLVLRQNDERMALVESQQWIAPLAQEVRAALAADLAALAPPAAAGLQLRVDVTRFESALGRYVLLESQWQLRAAGGAVLNCGSRSRIAVGGGYDALVAGHQQALQQLAADIAATARRFDATPACAGGGR